MLSKSAWLFWFTDLGCLILIDLRSAHIGTRGIIERKRLYSGSGKTVQLNKRSPQKICKRRFASTDDSAMDDYNIAPKGPA